MHTPALSNRRNISRSTNTQVIGIQSGGPDRKISALVRVNVTSKTPRARRPRTANRIAWTAVVLIAALVVPDRAAQAALHGVYLESRLRAGVNEVTHYGTLSDFSGSTRSTYPTVVTPATVVASTRYTMAPDRLSVTFEMDHERIGDVGYDSQNIMGLQIHGETDYRFEVSGDLAFADPSSAEHTLFGYQAKIYGPDRVGVEPIQDYRFLFTAVNSRSNRVTAVEFGRDVQGGASGGILSTGTQGILEAGLVYNLEVTTNFGIYREAALSSADSGTGSFTLTLIPIPEPGTAVLLGLGLGLTSFATRTRRRRCGNEPSKRSIA